jgi:hypothetical protein
MVAPLVLPDRRMRARWCASTPCTGGLLGGRMVCRHSEEEERKKETLNQKILMKILFGKTLNSTFSPINVDATL